MPEEEGWVMPCASAALKLGCFQGRKGITKSKVSSATLQNPLPLICTKGQLSNIPMVTKPREDSPGSHFCLFSEGSYTTTSTKWISLFWLITPKTPCWKLDLAPSVNAEWGFPSKPALSHWGVEGGFWLLTQSGSGVFLGRSPINERNAAWRPLCLTPALLCTGYKSVSVEQLFCSTPGAFSFHGRSCELQAQAPADLWSSLGSIQIKALPYCYSKGGV